jgi:hypothetical protein
VTANNQWLHLLPMGQFTINSQPHSTYNGLSPCQVDLGYQPPSPIDTPSAQPSIDSHAADLAHFGTVAKAALVEAQKQARSSLIKSVRSLHPSLSETWCTLTSKSFHYTRPSYTFTCPQARPSFLWSLHRLRKKRDNVFHISQLRIQSKWKTISLPRLPVILPFSRSTKTVPFL